MLILLYLRGCTMVLDGIWVASFEIGQNMIPQLLVEFS